MKSRRLFILSIVFSGLILMLSVYPKTQFCERNFYKKFQKTFLKKIELSNYFIDKSKHCNFNDAVQYTERAQKAGIKIFIYKNDSLFFWSNNSINIPDIQFFEEQESNLLHLDNSLFYFIKDSIADRKIVALIRLQNNFAYNNSFLQSGVLDKFGLPEGSSIITDINDNVIVNEYGDPIFSINLGEQEQSYINKLLTTFLFFLIITFLLIISYHQLRLVKKPRKRLLFILFLAALFILIRWLLNFKGVSPHVFFSFDSFIYASYLAPSLGDLLINALLLFWFGFVTFRLVDITVFVRGRGLPWYIAAGVFLVLIYHYIFVVALSLVEHSSLNLVVHQFNDISLEIVVAYLVLILNYFAFGLLLVWFYSSFKAYVDLKIQGLCFTLIALVFYLLFRQLNVEVNIVSYLFLIGAYLLLLSIFNNANRSLFISYIILLVLVLTLYLQFFNIHYSNRKEKEQLITIADKLANERDPVAEYNLANFSKELKNDSLLTGYVLNDSSLNKIMTRISNNHLSGYWRKYNLSNLSICTPQYMFYDGVENVWRNCYSFYDSLIGSCGIKIPYCDFYYLNNYNGNISYVGLLKYNTEDKNIQMFVEIDSKTSGKLLGYPELMVDEKLKIEPVGKNYSYAKYHHSKLITQYGKYGYSLNATYFRNLITKKDKFQFIKEKDFIHLVHLPDNDNMIVVSRPVFRFLDYAVIFSYLFILIFSFIFSFILFTNLEVLKYTSINDYRSRIQVAILSILVFSMIVVGSSTITILIRNHNKQQQEILEEKIQSVYVELEHKISGEKHLTNAWSNEKYRNLNQLLIKFSDVFYSDINLYSPDGVLIATSRPELFDEGLKGTQINPEAYFNLHFRQKKQFVHEEQIYNLTYMSAYIPFYNTYGNVLAYLNLPYFTQQADLQKGITQLSVTIVNIYLFLMIITLFIAYVISNQLTRPIEILRHKLSELKLGASYEKIEYKRKDEIGKLVDQYNLTVSELEKSVTRLAQSERESAWREMAKQIAHEIKNPLTPMRLSVQHLLRTWKERSDIFEGTLNRTSETLLEQIDTLSNIATEFSNFAKMPEAHITDVNLVKILQKTARLFSANTNIKINAEFPEEIIILKADTEQLSRVFINIIKNAVQAIPEGRKGIINISVSALDKHIQVAISDNGKGIDKKIFNNLFQPNFTTKSGGTGLGLAIVKKILDEFNATINFESEIDKGTTFFITFKVISKN